MWFIFNVINIWSSQAQFAPSEQKLRSPASTAEKGFMFGSGEDDFYSYKTSKLFCRWAISIDFKKSVGESASNLRFSDFQYNQLSQVIQVLQVLQVMQVLQVIQVLQEMQLMQVIQEMQVML